MVPVNQVFLGSDPLLGSALSQPDYDAQLQALDSYMKRLEAVRNRSIIPQQKLIWDEIDNEVNSLSEDQKAKLLSNAEYSDCYCQIQALVNTQVLQLVKGKIEQTPEGKDLLQRQLCLIRKLKNSIIKETDREMDTFKRFKEFSKANPNATYEEFLKTL